MLSCGTTTARRRCPLARRISHRSRCECLWCLSVAPFGKFVTRTTRTHRSVSPLEKSKRARGVPITLLICTYTINRRQSQPVNVHSYTYLDPAVKYRTIYRLCTDSCSDRGLLDVHECTELHQHGLSLKYPQPSAGAHLPLSQPFRVRKRS